MPPTATATTTTTATKTIAATARPAAEAAVTHRLQKKAAAPKAAPVSNSSTTDKNGTGDGRPAMIYQPLLGPSHPKYTTTIDDVPEFLRDAYIMSGYRRLCYSYSACIRSMGYVHNESGNVLTHLASLVFFLGLALSTYYNTLPAAMSPGRASWCDYAVLYGYILSACMCFALSTLFHTFSCHSHSHHVAWLKCDFVGILVLILGSFLPGVYYGYFESRLLMVTYMAMLSVLFVAGVVVSISPHLQKPHLRWLRPIVFVSIAVSGFVPVLHHIIAHGIAASARSFGLYYMLGMCGFYVLGTLLYAFNIPERWYPGLFDIVGNSHQLFHCLVFTAALTHYYGIIQAFKWHHSAQSVV